MSEIHIDHTISVRTPNSQESARVGKIEEDIADLRICLFASLLICLFAYLLLCLFEGEEEEEEEDAHTMEGVPENAR